MKGNVYFTFKFPLQDRDLAVNRGTVGIADDHQVDIAGGVFITSREGAINKSDLDAFEIGKSFLQTSFNPHGFKYYVLQFFKQGMLGIKRIVKKIPHLFGGKKAVLLESQQLPSYTAGGIAKETLKLPEVVLMRGVGKE